MAAKFVRVQVFQTEEEDFGWSKEEVKRSAVKPVKRSVITALKFIAEGFLPGFRIRKKNTKPTYSFQGKN